jgi:hypothetical protein
MSDRRPGQVAEVLIQGYKFFQNRRNWCERDYEMETGFWRWKHTRYCAMGYVRHFAPDATVANQAIHILNDVAHEHFPDTEAIYQVNDTYGRHAVLECFKEAAQRALNIAA